MTRVTAELRDRLKAEGKWEAFTEKRRELRGSGESPTSAFAAALRFVDESPRPSGPGPLASGSVFEGKRASRAEEFDWVVAHLYVEDARPEDAPDAQAWTILQMCRRSPAFAEDLIGRGLVKTLPSKLEEREDGGRWDGEDVFDAWAMIRGAANG